jgi:hypothetical protein
MKRLGQIQVAVYERELAPPVPRRAFGLIAGIVCAVAAISFALGLSR